MQALQKLLLKKAAQQNIHLVVLIFAAAYAHGDEDTMQLVINNYAQQFNTSVQQAMRNMLATQVAVSKLQKQTQASEEALVAYLQANLTQQVSNSEDLMQQAQQAINKAMLH